MRAFVFTDKALSKHAGQFVWLSIDTEKAQNADFIKRYPVRAWPSLYVIDPRKEEILLRWVGGADVPRLEKLFAEGRRSYGGGADKGGELARADKLYGEGRYADSVPAYRAALASIPEKDARWARASESLLFALSATRQNADCAALALSAYPKLGGTLWGADLAAGGLDCALRLPPDAKDRAATVERLEAATRESLADPKIPLAADDRSSLYGAIFDARQDAKDASGAAAIAQEWVADLDARAARAATAEQRTAMDPNRYSAFKAAGKLEKAIPMLEQSERDFPKDYNPPARLASAYLSLRRFDEALAASDRALALVYGPRRMRVLLVRADIYKGKGDAAMERKTLEDAAGFAQTLPEAQRTGETIAELQKRLQATGDETQH
jgi:tetratricopeptide (TPR) repeat protein